MTPIYRALAYLALGLGHAVCFGVECVLRFAKWIDGEDA